MLKAVLKDIALFDLKLSAVYGCSVGDNERAMLGTGQDACCQGLIFVGLGQHSAGPARRIEDLDPKFARYVISPFLIDRHAVTFRGCQVRWWLVELEFAVWIDRQTHRHDRHLRIELSGSIDAKHPGCIPSVIGDSQRSAIVGQGDTVGFADSGIGHGRFAGCWIDPHDLLGTGVGEEDMPFGGNRQIVGIDPLGDRLDLFGFKIDRDDSAFGSLAADQSLAIGGEFQAADRLFAKFGFAPIDGR